MDPLSKIISITDFIEGGHLAVLKKSLTKTISFVTKIPLKKEHVEICRLKSLVWFDEVPFADLK